MSEAVKNPEEAEKSAETPTEEKKDAEGQSVWKWYCADCGCVFFETRIAPYCPKCNSPRTRHI